MSSVPLVDLQAEYQTYAEHIDQAIKSVLTSGAFILGPPVSRLESALQNYLLPDQDHDHHPQLQCVAVSDGTAALQLCLMALEIGPGHQVITTPFTWISSAEVIPLVGATTIFADVQPSTFLIDPDSIRARLTPDTRAVIVVSLYGLVPDLPKIRDILDDAEIQFSTRIALIEDAAQSFGAVRHANPSCTSPHLTMSTTSFFPTKPLSCYGDGGAVFTRQPLLADALRSLRVHGKHQGKHTRVGLNSRLDTLQAAILLAKLPFFPQMLEARRRAAHTYSALLQEDSRIILPDLSSLYKHDNTLASAWGVYTVRVQQRDAVAQLLRNAGVSCAVYYATPVHLQPVFADLPTSAPGQCPVAESLSRSVLSLPMHPYLTEEVQTRVVKELRTALDELSVQSKPMLSLN